MLVLSRKDSEQIVIDDQICIKVLSIRGNTVRLGIEAPRSVSILRGEIVSQQNDSAALQVPIDDDRPLEGACALLPILKLPQAPVT